MTDALDPGYDRICATTGFGLIAARIGHGWRVAKEFYVDQSGINGVLATGQVGPLPVGVDDSRGRYDTVGRTVYFGASRKVCLAEVLQALRAEVLSMVKDAAAIGMELDEYRSELTRDFEVRGLPAPGDVSVEWQFNYGLFKVEMPTSGWWVRADCAPTLNALSEALQGEAGVLTIADVCGDDRGLTTQLAQIVRESTLDDGNLPLGIVFPSKTGYGSCWAWWNRRADDNLNPSINDPRLVESLNVHVSELDDLTNEWNLRLVAGVS